MLLPSSLCLFLVGPALAGLLGLSLWRLIKPGWPWRTFRVGVPIVYRLTETSTWPGRDAHEIEPAARGEFYYFVTHKYWRVEEVRPDGWIVARNGLMEQHLLRRNDPNLRRASFIERLRYATRFPYPA
jgi:hypothetical protein